MHKWLANLSREDVVALNAEGTARRNDQMFLRAIVHIVQQRVRVSVPIIDVESAMVACDMAEDEEQEVDDVACLLQIATQASNLVAHVEHDPGEIAQWRDSLTWEPQSLVTREPSVIVTFKHDDCIDQILESLSRLQLNVNARTFDGTTVIRLPYPWSEENHYPGAR